MSENNPFEISDTLITKDNFEVEIKGLYKGKLSQKYLKKCFQLYLSKINFLDSLVLVEKDDLINLEEFSELGATYLKVSTISAIQLEDFDDKYAIIADLEGKKKRKGLLARFKK